MIQDGPDVFPGWQYIRAYGPVVATIGALKFYFRGKQNTWERDLHGKVYIITGGTSGLGAAVVEELAAKGAQIILLVRSLEDFWLTDHISELRERHNNFMIYAEECDLSSLHSVRKFATKWLDNVPPRRLDGVVCCAGESLPAYKERENSVDGIEIQTAVNYVGHFHLLTLLSPSLRSQLPDRDVRVILTTCMSQAMGQLDVEDPLFLNKRYPSSKPWNVFGLAKLELGLFAKEYQRRLLAIPRKDGSPCNVRINLVNPGLMRSPSTKRVASFGSLFGLLAYVCLLPILWIFLKSSGNGAQSIFHALYSSDFVNLQGGNFIANCNIYKPARGEFEDEELQKQLYDNTEKDIAKVEKESAIRRKRAENLNVPKKEEKIEELGSGISLDTTKENLFPDTENKTATATATKSSAAKSKKKKGKKKT